jgi:hypothetical protein
MDLTLRGKADAFLPEEPVARCARETDFSTAIHLHPNKQQIDPSASTKFNRCTCSSADFS